MASTILLSEEGDDAQPGAPRITFAEEYEQGVPVKGWLKILPYTWRRHLLPKPRRVDERADEKERLFKLPASLRSSHHETLEKHAHWTRAPTRDKMVGEEVVKAYYDLARAIGRFSLYGRGYEIAPHKQTRLGAFEEPGEDLEARMWTEKDTMLSAMPPEHRKMILDVVFMGALQAGDTLGKNRYHVTIDPPGESPQYVREFADMVSRTVVPEIASFIKKLPASLQAHPEAFFNHEFYRHLEEVYRQLVAPNIVEEFLQDDSGQQIKVLQPSLAYTLARTSDPRVPDLLGRRAAHRLFGRSKDSFIRRHKRSSGIMQAIGKRFGRRNKHILTEEDITEFNVLRQAYESSPESLESVIRAANAVYRYAGHGEEYAQSMEQVIRNAHSMHVDTSIIGAHGKVDDAAYHASDRLHRTFMDGVAEFDDDGAATSNLDDRARAVLHMFKAHAVAAENYRNGFSGPLTQARIAVARKAGEHVDHRTEGPLVRYGNYFEGTERVLNSSSQAGFFYHLADTQHERFFKYVDQFKGLGLVAGFTSQANVEKIRDWLESGGHHHAIVRPNTLGSVYTLVGAKLSWWAMQRGYHNLRDNSAFWSPFKAVRQVVGQVVTGNIGALIEDAFKDSEIPDNPLKVSLDIPDRVDDAFHHMRPAYLRQRHNVWNSVVGSIPVLGTLPFVPSAGSVEQYLARISENDFVADEDNIPTLAAIGMLNVRRNDLKYARKYLGMTSNWAETARKKGLPANNWGALAQYELSVMYGIHSDEERREEHLLSAFDTFAQLSQLEVAPFSTGTKDLERYCLLHPMNYGRRLELLRKADCGYTSKETSIAAHHAASELETILRAKEMVAQSGGGKPLDPAVRERLMRLRDGFKSLIIDAEYTVVGDEPAQKGYAMDGKKENGLESRVKGASALPAAMPNVASAAAAVSSGYVDPKYRLSNDLSIPESARSYFAALENDIYAPKKH